MDLLLRRPDQGYLDNNLWIPKSAINAEGVKQALTYQFVEKQSMRVLTLYKETDAHLIVPREFWQPNDFSFPVIDLRPRVYTRAEFTSRVHLDHVRRDGELVPTGLRTQSDAMSALMSARGGILQLGCGVGKTVVALDFIVRRGVPAIIILDTTQLMHQWREEITTHLDVPGGIGLIQGDTFDWEKSIVLATYHTLSARALDLSESVRRWFGTIVWDECHHVAAPTFSRTADLFYGYRLGLTATPNRDDGSHVIYNFHLGPVIYKNLTQALRPRIYFMWTGIKPDMTKPEVRAAVCDKNGEVHLGKLASYLGRWEPRIQFTIDQIREAVAANRKVLVLSKSVDTLVNLLAAWNSEPFHISDIPFPTAAEVGAVIPPAELEKRDLMKVQRALFATKAAIAENKVKDTASAQIKLAQLEQLLEAHAVFKKCESLWNKRRGEYLDLLLEQPSSAGLLIYEVAPEIRLQMLREKQVVFAISKYGREGLNEKMLDTVIAIEPLAQKEGLQQLLGRVLREANGKCEPVAVFFEDDVGQLMGMCQKMRRHLREWPLDEGGPLEYENIGHPISAKRKTTWNSNQSAYATTNPTLRVPGS